MGSAVEATRVPLIVDWPGVTKPARVCQDVVDFTGLLPTFAEGDGARLPEGEVFDGRSFLPQTRSETGNPRERAYFHGGIGGWIWGSCRGSTGSPSSTAIQSRQRDFCGGGSGADATSSMATGGSTIWRGILRSTGPSNRVLEALRPPGASCSPCWTGTTTGSCGKRTRTTSSHATSTNTRPPRPAPCGYGSPRNWCPPLYRCSPN